MQTPEEIKQQQHDNALFISLKDWVDLRFAVADKAIDKAENSMSKRLDTMNEFRQQLNDAQKTYFTRSEFDGAHQRVIDDIKELQKCSSSLINRREFDEHLSQYAVMKTDVDIAKGKASMTSVYVAWLLSGASLIVGIIHLFGK